MSLGNSHWYYFDLRYQLSSALIGISIFLFLYLFDTLGYSEYWLIAVLLGIIVGIIIGYIIFDWNTTSDYGDIKYESEAEIKKRQLENRKLLDQTACMSCNKPITEDDEFCKSCGFRVGKHKVPQEE